MIIDNITVLLEKSDCELEELLLDEKYNKANLRELVRRLVKAMQGDKQHIAYLNLQIKQLHKTINIAAKELGYGGDSSAE